VVWYIPYRGYYHTTPSYLWYGSVVEYHTTP
jgi:hypothetical protein